MWRNLAVGLLLVPTVGLGGCHADPANEQAAGAPAGTPVPMVKVERKTLRRVIEQPAQIEAFEETPLLARLPGYVSEVKADIGMQFKRGDVLARQAVPELVAEHQQKQTLVGQAQAEVKQAQAQVEAALAHVETAAAHIKEMAAGKDRVDANYARWDSEYNRHEKAVANGVLDKQTLEEALNQRQAADAARKELAAKVESAAALHKETQAMRDKAKADLAAAESRVKVSQAEESRVSALLSYADICAPYNCVVVRRNVHTGHFLQPASGSGSQPIFVVANTNILRVVVDVPETAAGLIKEGMEVSLRVASVKNQEFKGKVSRVSGAIDAKSRTLRTEIDLDNKDQTLRPGMYAYASFNVYFPDRLTLPAAAVVTKGDETYCWQIVDGKAKLTGIKIGLREGGFVEVLKKQVHSQQPGGAASFVDVAPGEQLIGGNLGNLTEGQIVTAKQ